MSLSIVRKKLSAAEVDPQGLRWNEDCDCVQQNVGGDWTDSPTADPRVNLGYQYPPITTSDPACDGAARMAAAVERTISTMTTAASVIEAVNTIIAVIAVWFPPVALFVALLFALVNAASAIGFAAVALAFTDTVYDEFKCIAFCHLGAGGQFDEESWGEFQDEIGAHFGLSTVTAILSLMFNGIGMVGFNNMATVGAETGDCSACGCGWGAVWDMCTDVETPWVLINGDQTGAGVVMANEGGWASAAEVHAVIVTTGTTIINSIGVYFDDGGGIDTEYRLYINSGTDHFTVANLSTGLAEITGLALGAGSYTVFVIVDNAALGVVGLLTGVRVTGVGTNPFSDHPDEVPPCQP